MLPVILWLYVGHVAIAWITERETNRQEAERMKVRSGGHESSRAVTGGNGGRLSGSSIVATRNFLLATRDSGYRSTASAVSEFVDNSIQAGSQAIHVHILKGSNSQYPVEIVVSDDGQGMASGDLSQALTFGGSARFGDRSSLGRYGMGLPNAALSCARRVDVYSWRSGRQTLLSTLDIDELMSVEDAVLASPVKSERPPLALNPGRGTLIHLRRCDRLEYRLPSTIAKKLSKTLGRTYRHYLKQGLAILVNGEAVSLIDPLFLDLGDDHCASQFGDRLTYDLSTPSGRGTIEVVFTELPVEAWADLPPAEKRRRGITNAANVSIVRADREIDSGWWFMGKKRRQNYDDWWRCEVRFDPELDELFGITHTKQQVTPSPELRFLLSSDLEPVASALNARVRRRFELASTKGPLAAAARTAALCSSSLPPLHGYIRSASTAYKFDVGEILGTSAFAVETEGQDLSVVVNERHPIYRDVLRPLAESDAPGDQRTAKGMALLLLALARAEAAVDLKDDRNNAERFRHTWSDVAATFLTA